MGDSAGTRQDGGEPAPTVGADAGVGQGHLRGGEGLNRVGICETPEAATALVKAAWPRVAEECQASLGGELHYQAVIYHCLRRSGVPLRQLGMNVKQMITDCVSPAFRARTLRRHPNFQGDFEPIPDVVLFSSGISGDWRRRNAQATLRHMVMAIEVKASERDGGRLRSGEIVADLEKLAAHQIEVAYRGGNMLAAMMIIDTAVHEIERMTARGRAAAIDTAKGLAVALYYVSPDEALCV